jgi:hypothetical protein
MSTETAPETTTPEKESKPRKTAKAWKDLRVHKDVTLPSGMVVDIELPDLPSLAKAGDIPGDLLASVTKLQEGIEDDAVDVDDLVNLAGFSEFIIPRMVTSPKVTEEDVVDLPAEDKGMLLAFAARRTDIDAVGHHLAGLEKLDAWRQFRQFDYSLAGAGGF